MFDVLFFFFSLTAHAQGGPPMVTDDPGTPGNHHWEINIASLYSQTESLETLQAPYFDINYGWGDHVQLKIETGYSNLWTHFSNNASGLGTLLAGVKYRFLDEKDFGVAVSTYPQFQFHHLASSHNPELAEPGNQYLLPLEFSKTVGVWEFNPAFGYLNGDRIQPQMIYGLVVAYEKWKPLELLAEVYVDTDLKGEGSTTLLNFGLRFEINSNLNLLVALGETVSEMKDELAEVDAYLGIQIDL